MEALSALPVHPLAQALLGEVVGVNDPQGLNRVQVRLHSFAGASSQNGEIWARVAVPFAGSNRGAFMLPDVGDEVLVTFANGDSRFPIVIGSFWNGRDSAPETLGGSGDAIDRWTIVGKAGTRIAIEEPASGQPTIKLTTPGRISVELTDTGGGKLECKTQTTTITVDPSGMKIQSSGTVSVEAPQVKVTAGMVTVDAAMSVFSGVVKCDTLISNAVVSASYTPGVGNIW